MSGYWIAAYLVLWVAVLLALALNLGLLRRIAAILPEVEDHLRTTVPQLSLQEGLRPGNVAPTFDAITADGTVLHSSEFSGVPRIALLLDMMCGACHKLINELVASRWSGNSASRGYRRLRGARCLIPTNDNTIALRQVDGTVSAAFRSSITPQAFGINSDDVVIATGIVGSVDALTRLAQRALEEGDHEIVRTTPA